MIEIKLFRSCLKIRKINLGSLLTRGREFGPGGKRRLEENSVFIFEIDQRVNSARLVFYVLPWVHMVKQPQENQKEEKEKNHHD